MGINEILNRNPALVRSMNRGGGIGALAGIGYGVMSREEGAGFESKLGAGVGYGLLGNTLGGLLPLGAHLIGRKFSRAVNPIASTLKR